jgi:hypothetical protein
MNWRRISERDRVRRHGIEDVNGGTAFHVPRFEQSSPKYRRPLTKTSSASKQLQLSCNGGHA